MINKTTSPFDEEAADFAETIVKQAHTSFYDAMRFLPPDKRRAIYAVYAFCRQVDDIADGEEEAGEKKIKLDSWRKEIEVVYEGGSTGIVGRALRDAVPLYNLQKGDFLAVIDGMEMDAGDKVRLADMLELGVYCDRVACAVGRLSNRIFGIEEEHGDLIAHALGEALQLTNILRDLKEDAGRNRLYLPLDVLQRHGVTVQEPKDVLEHPDIYLACEELAALAEDRFGVAEQELKHCTRNAARPPRMMMEVYRRILARLRDRGWEQLDKPVSLSAPVFAWLYFKSRFL